MTHEQMIFTYFAVAAVFAVIELRLEGGVYSPSEAFWMTVLVTVFFPAALIRRTYILLSTALFVAIGSKHERAAEVETAEVIKRVIANKAKFK